MAAGLGFKTFTSGEVLTAADTNGYLMQGILVFASAAARDAAITSPQEGQYAYLKDTNATTYYTGSAWVASAGGGKVLQVVQGTTSTAVSISTTTYTDSGITLAITPTLNTSKVLVMVTQQYRLYRNGNTANAMVRLLRDSTAVWNAPTLPGLNILATGTTETQVTGYGTYMYLDSPATTSSTTYKTQYKCTDTTSSPNIGLQTGDNTSTIILMEIGA